MTSELHQLLDHIGYSARPQQEKLFDLLSNVTTDGIIAQAGTGTGKSIAVLAAAAKAYNDTGIQSLVVTPTRVLMDQYMASDVPSAAECFGLAIAELRGKRWYDCDLSIDFVGTPDPGMPTGCLGKDSGCSLGKWEEANFLKDPDLKSDGTPYERAEQYDCGYQAAKHAAKEAAIVVTNTDFWIINDRTLPEPIFNLEGAVFVDEAHQLEAKLKDYAGCSLRIKEIVKHFTQQNCGLKLGHLLSGYQDGRSARINAEVAGAIERCYELGPDKNDAGKASDRALEVHEGFGKIISRLATPSDNCLIWSDGWSVKMDFIDISGSARGLLTARPFGLVSATIPKSMPSALGVADTAKVEDVGHPFDYAKQATLSISKTDGAFKYAGSRTNFVGRVTELMEKIEATKGGCLLLFSSFADMKRVHDEIEWDLKQDGRTVLLQKDEVNPRTNDELAAIFKADGRAVLFGSESFATGFDVPGDALELVSLWKLPYPGKDPVTEAMMKRFYPRYRDLMLTRIVQGAGRLIRTETDRGHLHICDARAEDIVKSQDLMVRHLGEFARG